MVSICIPTYNQTEYLSKLLDSIAIQTYKDFEVVVCDDSSNDNVKQLIDNYTSKFKITYYKNSPALGAPLNWNKAIELSKGDLIKIMHHDDWFENENGLQIFMTTMKNQDVDFVFCSSKILNVKDSSVTYNSPDDSFVQEISNKPITLFNNNKIGAPSATLFKRSIFEPFDGKMKYLVDVDFYINLLNKSKNIHFIKEALIVNTSNNLEQVTAQSINKHTQIGEYCYLYNKHFKGQQPDAQFSKFFKELFAWYGLKNFNEITSLGWELPQPISTFKWLLFKAKLSKLF